jgi:RNA polymerase sigma-70 factor (ECF subfamily)
VNGTPGVVAARHGRPAWVLTFAIADGRITGIRVLAGPERLGELELAEL